MNEKPEPRKAEPASERGVFGNLPDARPGTRSPRRTSTKATAAKATTKATSKPRASKPKPSKPKAATAKATRPQRTDAPPPPAEPRRPAAAEQQPGGLADVAWAGIAVAAEAATIGVRLASRAIEAVRGNSERD